MSVTSKITSLKEAGATVLTDPGNDRFQELLKRWSDIDLQVPGAIVLPTSEDECQKIVKWAVDASVPFVTRSGGHSSWSTIGNHGIIIDLSEYSGVEVDKAGKTATLIGSVLTKQVGVALAEEGLFTALGNGNTVGAIPYFLGGGASITSGLTGYGSDQIVSSRVVTAKGDLLTVSENENSDLLWAIRGAGQFFGLVTQLVVRAYPFSALGNDKGLIWSSLFIFPLTRAKEVASAMKILMDDSRYATGGLIMVMAPPPKQQPSLAVSARYIGDLTTAKDAYKALYDLGPIVVLGGEVPIQNVSDGREALGAKGGFKGFGTIGLQHFDEEKFLKTIDIWKEMIAECPDAITTTFNFQWDSRPVKSVGIDSAMSHHDIRYWQNNITWHTDAKSLDKVAAYNNKCLDLMRGSDQEIWVTFQNATRDGPIKFRYRGKERLERLKALKAKWDPTGIFTHQLLD